MCFNKNIRHYRNLFALILISYSAVLPEIQASTALQVPQSESSPVVSPASLLLNPKQIESADKFYQEFTSGYDKAVTPFNRLERMVKVKNNFDRQFWYDANYILRSTLTDNSQDFQTWFLLYRTINEIKNNNYTREAEICLTKLLQTAKTDIERAVVFWLAAGQFSQYDGLRAEALKLAPQDDIEKTIDNLLKFYPAEFQPYLIDQLQQADLGKICMTWTYPLVKKRSFRYEDYVTVTPAVKDMAVIAHGHQLCFEGLSFGENYKLMLKKGLPSQSGKQLAQDQWVDVYVSHRKPTLRFREQGYILPPYGPQTLPLISVNVEAVNIKLYHITEQDLLSMPSGWYKNNLRYWDVKSLTEKYSKIKSHLIWQGIYKSPQDPSSKPNETVVSGIPIDQLLGKKLLPGIYLLEAKSTTHSRNDNDQANQIFLISDIGLSTFKGPDGLHVYARSMTTSQPLENVDLKLIAQNNRILNQIKTQKNGYAHFSENIVNGEKGDKPSYLEASLKGTQFSILNLQNNNFNLSDRGDKGRQQDGKIDGYIYSERGIYRPGEKVNFVCLLRNDQGQAVQKLPLTLRLTQPDGMEIYSTVLQDQGAGSYPWAFTTQSHCPTGAWTAKIFIDPSEPPIAVTTFMVSDFVPPRIEIKAKSDDKVISVNQPHSIDIDTQYYFGAAAANLQIKSYSELIVEKQFFKQWPQFAFGLIDEKWTLQRFVNQDQTTNDQGQARVSTLVDSQPDTTHLLTLKTHITALEPGGRGRSIEVSTPLWHQNFAIGIAPRFQNGSTASNTVAEFDVIAVNRDGILQTKSNLRYNLYQEQQDYVWFEQSNRWQYEVAAQSRLEASGQLDVTSDQPYLFKLPVKSGRYRLEIMDEKTGVGSSIGFNAGWMVPSNDAHQPDMLEIDFDKNDYKKGDKIQILVKTPFAGTLFLTAMGKSFIPLHTGPINKDGTVITLTLTEKLTDQPGSYIVGTVFRPGELKSAQMPARAIGLKWLNCQQSVPKIDFSIEVPQIVNPNQTVMVNLKLPKNRSHLRAAVAVVDESLLSLSHYASPNPYDYFFSQKLMRYKLQDNYGYLINPYGARPGSFEVGGGGIMKTMGSNININSRALSVLPAQAFKIVSLFSGIIECDGQTSIQIPFKIPEFTGKLRIMATAWDEHHVGQAESSVLVQNDIDLNWSLPRFLAPDDQAVVPLTIHNLKGHEGDYRLQFNHDGQKFDERFNIKRGQQKQFSLPLVTSQLGVMDLIVQLQGPQNFDIKRVWQITSRSPRMKIERHRYGIIEPQQNLTLDGAFLQNFQSQGHQSQIIINPVLDLSQASLIDELMQYPYDCLEQTASRVVAGLYNLNRLTSSSEPLISDNLKKIDVDLGKIYALQRFDGSFGLWSSASNDEPWLSLYIADIFDAATRKKMIIPSAVITRLNEWVDSQIQASSDNPSVIAIQSYAYYLVAKQHKGSLGQLRYFSHNNRDKITSGRDCALIGGAYAYYGDAEQATQWFDRAIKAQMDYKSNLETMTPAQREDTIKINTSTYGSELRDWALVVALLAESFTTHPKLQDLIALLADHMSATPYLNTQEKAWLVRAAHAFQQSPQSYDLTIDDKNWQGQQPIIQDFDPDKIGHPLIVKNNGTNRVYYTTVVSGTPNDLKQIPQHGFKISRELKTLNGEPVDTQKIQSGNLFVVHIKGRRMQSTLRHAIVVDLLPAGFEIEETKFSDEILNSYLKWLGPLTTAGRIEGRDDRFIAAFELNQDDEFSTVYTVRATVPGQFVYPAVYIEGMYQPQYFSYGQEGKIHIHTKK